MTDREIYEEVRGSLMRFAGSLVGPDDADDIVSDAVVRTLRRGPLAALDNPRAYLMRAVLNAARDRGRRLTRERAAVARHAGIRESVPVVSIDSPELTETVMRLPVRQRAAVFLVYFEDMAPSGAAHVLGVRPATLRRYLLLARRKLRGWLDE
jgi:RNA polymerase sigma-70 factor (ECF subfamily)